MTVAWFRKVQKSIARWYLEHARELPWRTTHDPYPIWVSEIMLQQTQVATVLPYFERFLHRFPDVTSLANADEREVLRHWEGLGYYRRAKQLHQAAKQIVSEHGGSFPSDFQAVLALPGIGRYTAGAICSFAWDQPMPIVEANTQRLYARLLGLKNSLTSRESQQSLWEFATRMAQVDSPGRVNQALMELGALVCKPTPQCDACPLRKQCITWEKGWQNQIPAPKPPKVYTSLQEVALVFQDAKKRWLLRRCQEGERWAGLWDFPRYEIPTHLARAHWPEWLTEACRQGLGRACRLEDRLLSLEHAVTRYRIQLECYRATWVDRSRLRLHPDSLTWVSQEALTDYPLCSSGRKIAARLSE